MLSPVAARLSYWIQVRLYQAIRIHRQLNLPLKGGPGSQHYDPSIPQRFVEPLSSFVILSYYCKRFLTN